jgi:hypothetical protein
MLGMEMPLEPLHPAEPTLHHALRDTLNQRLTNTEFFVLISVMPTGHRNSFEDLDQIVLGTEGWLSMLHPGDIDPDALPEKEFSDPAADVTVRAVPKKASARGRRSAEIVGNPEPALSGWV